MDFGLLWFTVMPRYLKLILLLFLCLLLSVLIIVVPAFSKDELQSTVFAKVYSGVNSYIADFAPGSPNGSVVLSAQSLPNSVQPDSVTISSNGQWIFAIATPNANGFKPVLASRIGHPFTNSYSFPSWTSLSADSQYLFYLSVDDSGHYETFNFLRLSTGAVIQFLVAPLVSSVNPTKPPFRLPQYARPLSGWTLDNEHVTFLSCRTDACFTSDIVGLFTVDLSGIDMTRSGYWNLPQRTVVKRVSQDPLGIYISPDGDKIAYIYLPYAQVNYSLAVQNLATGQVDTVSATKGADITDLVWGTDSNTLFYFQQQADQIQIYQYDLDTQQSNPVFAPLAQTDLGGALLCGDDLFYVNINARQSALYHVGLTDSRLGQALFTADRISLITCGTPYSWQPDKVGACNPFCTPTPAVPVGTIAAVQTLDLSGGDSANGQQLYNNVLGCGTCHNTTTIGPRTQGMYTRIASVRLKDPLNAEMTPEQYIAESILHPNAYIAPGFSANIMPQNFGNQLTLSDLRDLVAYLVTQR